MSISIPARQANHSSMHALYCRRQQTIRKVFKTLLPTYDVFDEARYFDPARDQEPIELLGTKIGITICEDIWTDKYLKGDLYRQDPVSTLVSKGARAIFNLSSSPYSVGKPALRREMVSELASIYRVPFYYCNAIGGNDELIFDGNSFAIDAAGSTIFQMPGFREDVSVAQSSAEPFAANEFRLNRRSMKRYFWEYGTIFQNADSRPRFLD